MTVVSLSIIHHVIHLVMLMIFLSFQHAMIW